MTSTGPSNSQQIPLLLASRDRWLVQADLLRPELQGGVRTAIAAVIPQVDAACYQQWHMVAHPGPVFPRAVTPAADGWFDLGEHVVGYFELVIQAVDRNPPITPR